jgi:hypothetical protein
MAADNKATRFAAALIIEDVLNGSLFNLDEFETRINALNLHGSRTQAALELHQAAHFLTDIDIRSRDQEYDGRQRRDLREAMRKLRDC